MRDAIRTRHMRPRTEEAYVHWIRRYIFFHHKRHPAECDPGEITQFLTALAALLFLYRQVLGCDPCWLDGLVRAKRSERLPVVLTDTS